MLPFRRLKQRNELLMRLRNYTKSRLIIVKMMYRIKKCVDYAHITFNCTEDIQQMCSTLDEDECEDDSNVQDPNVIANITNIMDDLQQRFKELHFSTVF